jgi:L-fuconolactonase
VLDHFGGPLGIGPYAGRRDEIFAYWKRAVAELAECENVFAKLGGLAMPINGFGFHKAARPPTSAELADSTRGYYLHMIEQFGPRRCMFESNFPVDKASCSYAVLWNSFKRITDGFSADEKAAMYHDTAVNIYRV